MKSEAEVAMRLLEKDSHDKQELVASLRKQLEDVKNINIEMHSRLQVRQCRVSNKQHEFLLKLLLVLPLWCLPAKPASNLRQRIGRDHRSGAQLA